MGALLRSVTQNVPACIVCMAVAVGLQGLNGKTLRGRAGVCLARCEEAKEHEHKRERLASHVVGKVAFSGNVELLLQDAGECLSLAVMRCGRYRHVYVAVSQEGFRVLRHYFTTGASPLSAVISGLLAGDPGCADRDVSDGCRGRGAGRSSVAC